MHSKKHNYKIGSGEGMFETNAYRKRPTYERVNSFLDEMGSDFSDHNVYLWGSWPDKKQTWDVDFLLENPGELDYEQMETISKNALKSSLNNNQFLADVGYTNRPIVPFNNYRDMYARGKQQSAHNGYVFGDKWMVDDKLYKDRTKFKNGVVIPKSNNILQVNSLMPYPKMINAIENNQYDKYYANKPILIKNRKKSYGI
tara:strand:+ start:1241 stop:1840 length:600 start_codon:yes stop_codon:yes gene_type:complete